MFQKSNKLPSIADFQSQFFLNFISGTILRSDCDRFSRMIFRISRGNVWMQIRPAEYELTVEKYNQEIREVNVFVILF
jgi:hypothetical protein